MFSQHISRREGRSPTWDKHPFLQMPGHAWSRLHHLPLTLRNPTQLFWSPSAAGRGSEAAPFPYSAGCQRAQALPKDVILFLQAIKPFTLQAASCLQLSHAWPRATSGPKKKNKSCVHLDANKRVFLKGLLLEFVVVSRGRASIRALPDNRQRAAGTSLPGAHHKQPQASPGREHFKICQKTHSTC